MLILFYYLTNKYVYINDTYLVTLIQLHKSMLENSIIYHFLSFNLFFILIYYYEVYIHVLSKQLTIIHI